MDRRAFLRRSGLGVGVGIAASQLMRLTGKEQTAGFAAEETTHLPLPHGDALLLGTVRWQQLRQQVLDALQRFHEKTPDEPGVNAARLRRMALPGLQQATHDALYQGLLSALLADTSLTSSGAWLHLPGHSVQLSLAEQALAEKLLPAIHTGRYDPPWVRDLARDFATGEEVVRQFLERQSQGMPGERRISLSAFDPANQLPPCAALEPFLPPGTRPWGQLSVGVRCDSPITWTVYVQAQVQVFGPYLVTTRALRSAEVIRESDIEVREGEISALPDNVLTATEQAIGHIMRFAQAAGSPLRAGSVRLPDAVRRGQTVPIVTRGPGFTASAEAQALSNAAPGEGVRIRLGNGQIVHGLVQPDGSVIIDF